MPPKNHDFYPTQYIASSNHFEPVKARNSEIWDNNGKRFIDLTSGLAVLNTGHNHPEIVKALSRQINRFISMSPKHATTTAQYTDASQELYNQIKIDTAQCVFFSTGAEAIEASLQIAYAICKRPAILSLTNGFHGRTLLCQELSNGICLHDTQKPILHSTKKLRYPSCFKLNHKKFQGDVSQIKHDIEQTLSEIKSFLGAIIFEPFQCEGGMLELDKNFLKALRLFATDNNIIFIADEIQAGMGRSGSFLASQRLGVEADIIVLSKSLGGGVPISCIVAKQKIFEKAGKKVSFGGTFSGNPLGLCAVNSVLKVIHQENLANRAEKLGKFTSDYFVSKVNKLPIIKSIRGPGLLKGFELHPIPLYKSQELQDEVTKKAFEEGLLIKFCCKQSNTFRFYPPLTIQQPVLEEALEKLTKTLEFFNKDIKSS